MRHRAFVVIAGLALGLGLYAAPAQAQANRTFVSGHGSDSNPCSLAAPCRSFAFALTQTNAGGEITVLDSAGYGTLTITKAVSITAPDGIEAGVTTTTATPAITISAGASDVVNLRGLTLVGLNTGTDGIHFSTGAALNVQNCKIGGFTNGILAVPTGDSSFSISDTIVSGSGSQGIFIAPTGVGLVTAVFKRVEASSNVNDGFVVDGEFSTGVVRATIADSVASNNGTAGIAAVSSTGKAATTLVVAGSQVVNNPLYGLDANGVNATMFVGQTTVSGNGGGWVALDSAVLKSYGNNYVNGNAGAEGAMPTVATK